VSCGVSCGVSSHTLLDIPYLKATSSIILTDKLFLNPEKSTRVLNTPANLEDIDFGIQSLIGAAYVAGFGNEIILYSLEKLYQDRLKILKS